MFIFSGEIVFFTIELRTVYDIEYLGTFFEESRTINLYADEEDALNEFDNFTYDSFYSEQERDIILQSHLYLKAWTMSEHGAAEDFDTREIRVLVGSE